MADMHVVVWDPSGEFWDGALVEPQTATVLRGRHVATLPIESKIVGRGAVAGYFRRSWGAGWPLNTSVPRLACPMLLHAVPGDGLTHLAWCARLVPDSEETAEMLRDGRPVGMLRLSPDSSQPSAFSGGFKSTGESMVQVEKLGKMDEHGGWTVYGTGEIRVQVSGYFGCALYGAMPGLAVAWAAVSQSRPG